jgi:hypothetical protein
VFAGIRELANFRSLLSVSATELITSHVTLKRAFTALLYAHHYVTGRYDPNFGM